MIRFQKPDLPSAAEIARYFALAEDDRWFSNRGPCHALLVERLQERLGLHCVPVANGTLALMVGLRALVGMPGPERDEVLLPSFTFAATANAVLWAGLRPVFVDVESTSWHLNPSRLEHALGQRGPRVAAVLACSTFGVPPPVDQRQAWEDCCAQFEVPLLVDSAAGFGAQDTQGHPLGGQGDAEVFSFHATKPFAIGEGGVITTASQDLAQRMMRLANFGFTDGIVDDEVGLNAKLAEWPAATALAVLDSFDSVIDRRRRTASEIWSRLDPDAYTPQDGTDGAVWQFVPALARTPEIRVQALAAAQADEIELRTYYSVPLHRMPAFETAAQADPLEVTERLAGRMLSLPMANDLSPEAIERIVSALNAAACVGGAT